MAMQMRKPPEKVHESSSSPERVYSTGDRSVTVLFTVNGPEQKVRTFLQESRSLDSLGDFIEANKKSMEAGTLLVSCEISGRRITNPAEIVPAIRQHLGVQ